MITPLVSVIVPIYNVKSYLRKCLDSLKRQRLKQIEVIMIDDGSTDGSGEIADEYAVEDERFRVFHTENRGLSAARNRGIDESRTDWLMFVDSDDWVSPDFCRVPYEKAIENRADLICFGLYKITRLGHIKKPKKNNAPIGIIDEMTAHEYGGTVAWNKMYKKYLFKNIQYPLGRVYEDISTTHKLIHKATRIVRIEDCLYFHIWRKGSITHNRNSENRKDASIAAWERYTNYIKYGYPKEKLRDLGCSAAIGILANTDYGSAYYLKAIELLKSIDGIPMSLKIKKKIAFIVWKYNQKLFYVMCRVTRRK